MISKIKSRKIANIKILIGFVLAVSLVAVFACEQKQSEQSEKVEIIPVGKTITIIADGKPLQITGDDAGIEKLKSAITSSDDFEFKSDPTTGKLILTAKANRAVELTVSALGTAEKTAQVKEEVYVVVDQMPEFPGGESEFRNFLAKSVKYPAVAAEKGIQGKVFVTFIVAKDGSIKNSKIIRGVDPMLDAEALRVVNSMPQWTPGKQSDKDVAVSYTVPIYFKLE